MRNISSVSAGQMACSVRIVTARIFRNAKERHGHIGALVVIASFLPRQEPFSIALAHLCDNGLSLFF